MYLSASKVIPKAAPPNAKPASKAAMIDALEIYVGHIQRSRDKDQEALVNNCNMHKNPEDSFLEFVKRCAKSDFYKKNCTNPSLRDICLRTAGLVNQMSRTNLLDVLEEFEDVAPFDQLDDEEGLRASLVKGIARGKIPPSALDEELVFGEVFHEQKH